MQTLVCNDLWMRFGPSYALVGIEARFERGAPVVVRGPNGSGKSTLLSILAGLVRPSQGDVSFFDAENRPLSRDQVRQGLSYFGQGDVVYPEMSAMDNLLFHAAIHGLVEPKERCRALLDEMGMDWKDAKPCGRMSHGQKRRVGLARALLPNPEVLLLDEPDSGLDRTSRIHLAEVLMRRAEQAVLVVASHDDLLCSRMESAELTLDQGRVVERRAVPSLAEHGHRKQAGGDP